MVRTVHPECTPLGLTSLLKFIQNVHVTPAICIQHCSYISVVCDFSCEMFPPLNCLTLKKNPEMADFQQSLYFLKFGQGKLLGKGIGCSLMCHQKGGHLLQRRTTKRRTYGHPTKSRAKRGGLDWVWCSLAWMSRGAVCCSTWTRRVSWAAVAIWKSFERKPWCFPWALNGAPFENSSPINVFHQVTR